MYHRLHNECITGACNPCGIRARPLTEPPSSSAAAGGTAADRRILLATCFLRAAGTSLVGVLLGIHLAQIGFSAAEIGVTSGCGLLGAALGALAVTAWGDRLGRRRSLLASSAAMAAGSGIVALGSAPLVVTLGAFLGMLNAMGRDRGAAPVIEQAALPGTVADRARTRAFAGYGALQDAGHVAGSLMAAIPGLVASHTSLPETSANRLSLGVVPLFAVIALGLYLFLSPGVDAGRGLHVGGRVTLRTRRVLWRCSALFSLDGLGGGLLLTSLLAYFFFERFGASAPAVAGLLSAARVVNLGSNFLAAWLAARVGLVNTMVFTHIPSSLLLVGVALVPSFAWAVALFLARETVAKMDVPTRQSYLMAIVEPEARVVVAGVTDVVRLVAWALGPMLAGWLMTVSLVSPLLAGAAIKIVYDLLLYRAFRHVRPPEERTAPAPGR